MNRVTDATLKSMLKSECINTRRAAKELLSIRESVRDLKRRVSLMEAECKAEGVDPGDAQVYMAGKRDVYVGNVLITLEDLGVLHM